MRREVGGISDKDVGVMEVVGGVTEMGVMEGIVTAESDIKGGGGRNEEEVNGGECMRRWK